MHLNLFSTMMLRMEIEYRSPYHLFFDLGSLPLRVDIHWFIQIGKRK